MSSNDPQKEQIAGLYHRVAALYGHVGPSIFAYAGRQLVELLGMAEGSLVLDVAAGRGANLLRFSYANVCKHTCAQNFVVTASSIGASRPKPFGLTPCPQSSLRLRPSQYRRRLDQAARSSAGLQREYPKQRCGLDLEQTDKTHSQDSGRETPGQIIACLATSTHTRGRFYWKERSDPL